MPVEQIVVNNLLTSYSTSSLGPLSTTVPVLFLHGWGSSKEVWGGVMQSLTTKGLLCYALDLPGFGKTQLPSQAWSVEDYAAFVLEFLNKLNSKRVIVVGHSFGGRISLVLAATHGVVVEKLVLVDSAGVYTTPRFKKVLAVASKFVRPFFRLRWVQPLRKSIYRTFGAEDYVAMPQLNKTFVKVIGEDLTNYLPAINQPTLLIWGKNDLATPLSYAKHFLRSLPNAKLEVLERAGHYSFLDAPEQFLAVLENFIV